MTRKAFIVRAKRSPVVPKGGAFRKLSLQELAAPVVKACLDKSGLDNSQIDELILSNAVGGGGNPARLVALASGLPNAIGGLSIDRQCAGGLDAIGLATALVKSGQAQVVLAGGAESASLRPIRMAINSKGGAPVPYERPPFTGLEGLDPDMHEAASNVAKEHNISRAVQDGWAIGSHAKAMAHDFSDEIVAIDGLKTDAFPRNLSEAVCSRAKVIIGDITVANTAVDADAAAFTLIVSEEVAKIFADKIEILDYVSKGGVPEAPPIAPIQAMKKILARNDISPENLSAIEIMEAYGVQAEVCAASQPFNPDCVNIGGGALARGHPIGASGTVLAVRLFHELQKSKGKGIASIAGAGGIGSALLLSAL